MRVNLITRPSEHFQPGPGTIPLSLTIRPACGLPGDYECPTDSAALLRLLRRQTDLPAYVLQNFEKDLGTPFGAKPARRRFERQRPYRHRLFHRLTGVGPHAE